jgi:hypothetical protein
MIVPMARSGERIVTIASVLNCTDGLVARRLKVLGVEYWR